ncbi:hypothetical protein I79_007789 [Cricetulus griseus]|uniref:Uncharacterized protein n=1 Tax=Cricetulus griseus TaxID=10029 RepID=G3HBG1_CRIGR|nr:hypothetical protein I79_007789 [Cricetulus griseus]
MDMSMVLPRAVELLESDRCGTIISDLLWDAHKYPSYLISIEIKTLLFEISTAVFLHCVSFAKAENMASPPFCK